jgi:hypothetical protein
VTAGVAGLAGDVAAAVSPCRLARHHHTAPAAAVSPPTITSALPAVA